MSKTRQTLFGFLMVAAAVGSLLVLSDSEWATEHAAIMPVLWHLAAMLISAALYLFLDTFWLHDWFDIKAGENGSSAVNIVAAKILARGFVLGMMLYGGAMM